MKRTFGKLISLALVLAMVLAMVPAVLAAESTENVDAVPGETLSLGLPNTFTAAKYYWKSSSNYLTVPYDTDGRTNDGVIVSNAITQTTDNLYVYVYSSAAAADKNYGFRGTGAEKAVYAFKIKVTPWTVTLAVDSASSGFNNSLNAGESVTLRATVTGPADKIASQSVDFSIDCAPNVAKFVDSSDVKTTVKLTSTAANTGIARVEVTTGSATGKIRVTAAVKPSNGSDVTATYPQKNYIEVSGGASYVLTLAETNIYVTKGGTTKYIQPKLTRNGSQVTGTYTYESADASKVVVNSDGSIYPQVEETDSPIKVKVTEKASGLLKECYVSVVKNAATITDLSVSDDTNLSEKKFAKIPLDSKSNEVLKDLITDKVTLEATVVSESETAASRLVWTSSNEKIARVAPNSDGYTATVTPVAPGKVTITATMPSTSGSGTSKSVELYVWDTKAYKKVETPTVSGSINDPYTTCTELAKQPLRATLEKGTNQTVNLYASYTFLNEGSNYTFTGTVTGVDETSKIVYYPTSSVSNISATKNAQNKYTFTFSAGSASISTVQIDGPKDANYKVNEKLGSLTCTIRTTDNGEYITKVVWMDKNNNVVQDDKISATSSLRYHVSTLNLADKINSPGDYQYYCEVTTTKGTTSTTVRSGIANVVVGGDYIISIDGVSASVKVGDVLTLTAKPRQYTGGKYVDVTGSSYTIAWSVNNTAVGTLNKTSGTSVSFTAKGGGKVTVTAETTIGGNKYTGTKEITIQVPTADSISLSIGEDDSYVQLDGSKIVDAVKAATKGSSSSGTTLSTIAFQAPSNGDIYTNSNTTTKITYATATSVPSDAKKSSSDVSKMVFKPSTRNVANYTLDYTAYTSDGELATGKIIITGQGGSVVYHISAGESVAMQESDFLTVLRNGSTSAAKLSRVVFGTVSDSRGALYKGSTTSSGTVGTSLDCYATGQGSTGAQQLKNVNFIAGTSTAKYTVTVPFTVYGTGAAQAVQGNLIVYVNDTHTIPVTGSSFKDMQIGTELLPSSASTSSSYVTITSVISGKLYSSYASITDNTPLKTSDFGSTKYYFSGTGSIDSLYILPVADAKTVTVNYTLYDGSTTTKSSLSFKVTQLSASRNFSDVSGSTAWAANSVDFMSTNKLVNGVSNTAFGPNQTMTRAMLVTILYRAAGSPSVTGITNKFTDNKQGQYYYDAVLWAANKGVVTGASATSFDPDGKVTREQIAAILYRYAGSPTGSSTSLNSFSDSSSVSSYAVTALQWAVGKGIITGISTNGRTTLSAKNNANRAQVAVMLHRFLTFD